MNSSGIITFHYAITLEGSHLSDEYCETSNSGDAAFVSGIYAAEHPATGGKHAGEAVVIKGKQFPRCSQCGAALEFRLLLRVAHISEDQDFQPESEGRAA